MYTYQRIYLTFLVFIFSVLSIKSQIMTDPLDRVLRFVQLNEYQAALDALKAIEGADSEYLKGYINYHLSDPEQAIRHFRKAMDDQQKFPQVHLYYGHALSMTGKVQEAIDQYLIYARTEPNVGNHYAAVRSGQRLLPAESNYKSTLSSLSSNAHDVAVFRNHNNDLILLSKRSDVNRTNRTGNSSTGAEAFVLDKSGRFQAQNLSFYHNDLNLQTYGSPFFYLPQQQEFIYSRYRLTSNLRPSSTTISSMQLLHAVSSDGKTLERERAFPFSSDGNDGFPAISADGSMLIFASDRPGGYGGFDLYKVYRTANGWSAPVNLGPEINTPGDEIYPWLDGNILYFSSDWHPGFGGYDIFKSQLKGSKWTKPENLGATVNSPADELAFTFRAALNEGFYTSNKKSNRSGYNIYSVIQSKSVLELAVLDAKTGKPLAGASIREAGKSAPVFISDSKGKITIEDAMPGYKTWTLEAMHYQPITVSLDKPGESIMMQPLQTMIVNGTLKDQYNAAVADALVEWRELANNTRGQTFTNRDGTFNLNLSAPGEIEVSVTRRGYDNITQRHNATKNKMLSLKINKEEQDMVLRGAAEVNSAFTIRLGAFRNPDIQKIKALEHLGEPVAEQRNELMLISLAGFQNRDEAEAALESVKKSGYPEAFILGDDAPQRPSQPSVSHRIQIGVFGNPGNVDTTGLPTSLKVHYVERGNGLTALHIGDFGSSAEANNYLQQIRDAGFPGAFIVEVKP